MIINLNEFRLPSHYTNHNCQLKGGVALLDLCEGNPPVTGEFPSQRPVTQSFDILRRNKRLS